MASLANLVNETNGRFWWQTNYKIGQRLDMSDPKDRAMAKVWLSIYASVRNHRESAQREARRIYGESFTPQILVFERPDGSRGQATFPDRRRLDAQYDWSVNQIDTYRYIAAFDLAQDPNGPIADSFSPYAAEWDARQTMVVGAMRRPGPWGPRPRPRPPW